LIRDAIAYIYNLDKLQLQRRKNKMMYLALIFWPGSLPIFSLSPPFDAKIFYNREIRNLKIRKVKPLSSAVAVPERYEMKGRKQGIYLNRML
jgi:hypothetical protein